MYERDVLDIYRFCGITRFPVDLHRIINSIAYCIKTYSEESDSRSKLIELLRISGDAFLNRNRKTIYYNDGVRSLQRIRFSLAHELGHIIMVTDNEDLADIFASNLLAPRPIVYALGLRTAEEIATTFDVSISAANNVIAEMHRFGLYNPDKSGNEMINYFGLRESCPTLDNIWNKARMVR